MFKKIGSYIFEARTCAAVLLVLTVASCKKIVTIPSPGTSLVDATVFSQEQTATAAVLDIYFNLSELHGSPNCACLSKSNSLYADEYTVTSSTPNLQALYLNALDANDAGISASWGEAYKAIYKANAALEGIQKYGGALSQSVKNQLIGESKFLRGVSYFILVNMFGDVPLLLSTDYNANRLAGKTKVADIYAQIMKDFSEAKELVVASYLDPSNKAGSLRVRVNKDVITAMQAKVYLFMNNWAEAEKHADVLINNNPAYDLEPDLLNVFNVASKEAIWSFNDLGWYFPWIGLNYILEAPPSSAESPFGIGMLSNTVMNHFEPGDLRKDRWVGSISSGNDVYYFPLKYRSVNWSAPSVSQLLSAIRLGELYLIRAEAKIQQDRIAEGIADLNAIRDRARAAATASVPDPLPALPVTLSKPAAMLALERERITELFTEGHRFFDLKRWKGLQNAGISRADELMPAIAAAKGGTWDDYKKLFPIPQNDINTNANLKQNPEY